MAERFDKVPERVCRSRACAEQAARGGNHDAIGQAPVRRGRLATAIQQRPEAALIIREGDREREILLLCREAEL